MESIKVQDYENKDPEESNLLEQVPEDIPEEDTDVKEDVKNISFSVEEVPSSPKVEAPKDLDPVGVPFKPKSNRVKLQISRGPSAPVLSYQPLPYGRRKKRINDENAPKRVKLIISGKRLHPGTKANNILLEPLAEIQDRGGTPDDDEDKPLKPKFRRKRRAASDDVPLSMTPSKSILDAFEEAFDDNDDGFTTIKDLADRDITKLEPLDYDDFYYGAYDDDDNVGDDNGDFNEDVNDVEENVKSDISIKAEPSEDFDDGEEVPLATKRKRKVKADK